MKGHIPVKVGDVVYGFAYPRTDIVTVEPEKVEEIKVTDSGIQIETDEGCYTLSDFGRKIFLTEKEAKTAATVLI